jgi:metal-responsive CopG/Arc/MetJ family transcriptional regulator
MGLLAVCGPMPTDGFHAELEEIEVEFPRDLLEDIDDYAVQEGYRSPSDVVRAALE